MNSAKAAQNISADFNFKACIIGDSGVGKTSLLETYVHERFFYPHQMNRLGCFLRKTIEVPTALKTSAKIKWELWDTAGQERFRALSTAHYRGAVFIMLAFDVTSQDSFRSLDRWWDHLELVAAPAAHIVLVACKTDLEKMRTVPREAAVEWAYSHKLPYFECSSKEQEGLTEIFTTAGQEKMLGEDGVKSGLSVRYAELFQTTSSQGRTPRINIYFHERVFPKFWRLQTNNCECTHGPAFS